MTLFKNYIRKSGEVLGSVTSGYSDGSSVVRDEHDRILGHASDKFHTVRDAQGRIVSTNSSDPGFLISHRKK